MKANEFKPGMRVKMFDEDDRKWVHGEVVAINSPTSISIEWDDLRSPCEHNESEFENIKPSNPTTV